MLRALAGLGLLLLSCSSVEDTGSKLSTVSGFCSRWAEAACNQDVADQCAAENIDDCVAGQKAACVDRLPEKRFTSKNAKECLDAVEAAYKDAKLDPVERDIVINLGAPCDELLSGTGEGGSPCDERSDCNTKDGYTCIFKTAGAMGECRVPMVVNGGDVCSAKNAVCADAYYCDGEHCIAKLTAGETCSPEEPCADSFKCQASATGTTPDAGADGGADSGAPAAMSTCVEKADLGDECGQDSDCKSDMCDLPTGSTTGICAHIITLVPTEPICRDLR